MGRERGAAARVGTARGGAIAGDGRRPQFERFRALEKEPIAPGRSEARGELT